MNSIFNIANEIADGVMQHTDRLAPLGASLQEEVRIFGGEPVVTKITVHILHWGSPLCKFSYSTPSNWPEGHVWVSVVDAKKDATCPECLASMKNLPPQLPRI